MKANTTGARSITAGGANEGPIRGVLGADALLEALRYCRAAHADFAALELAVSTIESCLGCGAEYVGDCEECFQRLTRCLNVYGHWPMETAMTPAALAHVEHAIRFYLSHRMERDTGMVERPELRAELVLCASNIRSYLQHVAARLHVYEREPTDEELLS